ncbi:MAG: hypothetical protein ACM3TU_03330 [Bacillota bacterium]
MQNSASISKNVMRRVRVIHAVRPLLSTTALGVIVLVLALWGIGREVWVARVFENMPSVADLAAVTRFFAAAFLNTRVAVQVLLVLAAFASVLVVRDFFRNLSTVFVGQKYA